MGTLDFLCLSCYVCGKWGKTEKKNAYMCVCLYVSMYVYMFVSPELTTQIKHIALMIKGHYDLKDRCEYTHHSGGSHESFSLSIAERKGLIFVTYLCVMVGKYVCFHKKLKS